jgi:hypothetical protein
MISKVEQMNTSQENKSMLEDHKEKRSEEVQTALVQIKEAMNDHKDVSLPEIMKQKQSMGTRI